MTSTPAPAQPSTVSPQSRASAIEPLRLAVIIPCYNEAAAISDVVARFSKALPTASVYVYDNASTDGTADIAREAGAIVRYHPIAGKGNVVRRMFADIDADVYVLTDGDETYDPTAAPRLVEKLVEEDLDMVVGARRETQHRPDAYRFGHRFGNAILTRTVATLFRARLDDMLSGYRIFSRRFVKSFPASSSGFEIETEFTIHTLELQLPFAEVPTDYRERPPNSHSKLRTYRDGSRILFTIVNLFKEQRPFQFFLALACVFAFSGALVGWPVIREFIETKMILRVPSAILATGLEVGAIIFFSCGVILSSVSQFQRDAKRLAYLAASANRTAPGSQRYNREGPHRND